MFRINNNDFKILIKYKEYLEELDNILENVPRKDMYYKDKLRNVAIETLESIIKANYEIKGNYNFYYCNIKGNIAIMDFMLERLYTKKYINEKSLYKIGNKLIEINKMVGGWLNNINAS